MTEAPATVFLVDDDQDIRTSLSRALRMRGCEVETFDSATAFLDAYDGGRPGCLILDYGLPDMSGLELQRQLNHAGFPLAIIFITGHGGVPESVQAMKGGAVDFLEKPFRQAVLAERIQAAWRLAVAAYERAGHDRDLRTRFDRLTQREAEIVARMVQSPGEVSSKELGRLLGISPRTVDHHRARILEKLHVRSVAEVVALAKRLDR